jgi:hypothetical protein
MRHELLSLFLVVVACVGPSTEVPLDQDFDITLGTSITVSGTAQRITFEAVEEDSRCPSDAVCVWAGNARISLRVTGTPGDSAVKLNTGLEPRVVTVGEFRLELRSLTPVPRAGATTPATEYRATLRATAS